MSKLSFRAAFREADAVLQARRMPPRCDRRIRQSLFGPRKESPGTLRPWLALGAAVGALVVLLMVSSEAQPPASPTIGGFVVQDPTVDFLAEEQRGGLTVTAGACRLEDAARGMTLQVSGPTELRPEGKTLRLVRGVIDVHVRKRVSGDPVRMVVSGGVIEVLGTHYVVTERGTGGEVVLYEGAIRFVDAVGVVNLSPGQTIAWPRSVSTAPSSTGSSQAADVPDVPTPISSSAPTTLHPATGAPSAAPVLEIDVTDTLNRVAVLRSRGEYERAVTLLQKTLAGNLRPATRARLQFELGSILTYQIRDPERACEHWRASRAASDSSRYDVEAWNAAEALGCSSDFSIQSGKVQ